MRCWRGFADSGGGGWLGIDSLSVHYILSQLWAIDPSWLRVFLGRRIEGSGRIVKSRDEAGDEEEEEEEEVEEEEEE